jgi:hypothetical protein
MSALLNETQASKYLGNIPIRTLQRWRLEGNQVPYTKLGKAIRYRQSDLDAYIEGNIRRSTSDKGAAQ